MSASTLWRYVAIAGGTLAWCAWLWRVMLRPVLRPHEADHLRWYDRALRGAFALLMIAFLAYAVPRWIDSARAHSSQQIGGTSQLLPEGFASSVRAVKAKTRVPILLPTSLPDPIAKAKETVVDTVAEDCYAFTLYYELGIGDAGFAASFHGSGKARLRP